MIKIDLESPAPPNVVLAAMRAHAAEWRESRIPSELREAGIAMGRLGWWALLWPGSVWALAYASHRIASGRLSRVGSPPADYLLRRIEAAVAGAQQASSPAPAS
jgi:hypothetical protein